MPTSFGAMYVVHEPKTKSEMRIAPTEKIVICAGFPRAPPGMRNFGMFNSAIFLFLPCDALHELGEHRVGEKVPPIGQPRHAVLAVQEPDRDQSLQCAAEDRQRCRSEHRGEIAV